MKIAFHTPQIDVRGTCVALYDYALYSETLLGHTSIVVTDRKNSEKCDIRAVRKFKNRFPVFSYSTKEELHNILKREKCNVLYAIKYGKNDGIYFDDGTIKNAIHCVFDMSEPHGDVYAGVSKALAKKFECSLFVPHMIGLRPSKTKENLRKSLNIPENALVFGRHGGIDTFNLPFVHAAIARIVQKKNDIYFVFMGAPIFARHPQIIYLPPTCDDDEKNRFISTCDAHLECGSMGHSFGLAMGEFSINNKPIIVYKNDSVWNTAHYDILGEHALYFEDGEQFENIIVNFKPNSKDWNRYRDYSPEKVMKIFSSVFLFDDSSHYPNTTATPD